MYWLSKVSLTHIPFPQPMSFMEDALNFLEDGMQCEVVFYEGKPISVELPNFVIREISYTEPAVKGDTTSGKVMKPAKTNTGFELMVPLFCDTGDKIEIDNQIYLVQRATCQYRYAGAQKFVMVRKILQVKPIQRAMQEDYLLRQWNASPAPESSRTE